MSRLRNVLTSAAGLAVAGASIATLAIGTGPASADPQGATGPVNTPFAGNQRRCDHTDDTHVPSTARGTGYALISSTGNTVTADVHMLAVALDTAYTVKLIEMPRTTLTCNPGDPGVTVGTLVTDAVGNGTLTLRQAVQSGTTGVWVDVEAPSDRAVTTGTPAGFADFRTSDFVAPV